MAEAKVFEQVAFDLEQLTDFDRLEARGTLRLVLKKALFDPEIVSAKEMRAVLEKVLPGALTERAVADADSVCRTMLTRLDASAPAETPRDSADEIFGRMVRRA